MEVFATSDLHFWHKNIMKFCPDSRPFSSVEEMNEAIVENWNKKITVNDFVYILGDVSFSKPEGIIPFLKRLNGKKTLILGNHDKKLIKDTDFRNQFVSFSDYKYIYHNDKQIALFHYPIAEWDKIHHNSYHFHGHQHSKNPKVLPNRRYDVGLDGSPDFSPYNISELLVEIENRLDKSYNASHSHHYRE